MVAQAGSAAAGTGLLGRAGALRTPGLRSAAAALGGLLPNGDGSSEIGIDTNPAGRGRAVLRARQNWLHYVEPDELRRHRRPTLD